jgi:RsiW-degrading membrane proteinase PrsW (M82 family)
LVLTATVALFSYPLVRAYGLAAHNPTSLPHNYALNLMIVLGLVWSATAAVLLFGWREKGKSIRTVSQGRIGGNP